MLTSTYRFYILAFLLSLSSISYAHVGVVYPVGGETFTTGYSIEIEWEILQEHELLDWNVYYSVDSGDNWIALAIGLPASQLSFHWVLPAVETELGKIKVYMNNEGDDYIDYSGLFTIVPNTSPPELIDQAENIIIPCNLANQQAAIQSWLNNHGNASVLQYCGSPTWTNDFFLSNDCGGTGDSYVTFTFTDECGSTETTALLSIQDITAPAITSPAGNLTVETDGQGNITQRNAWLNANGGATATDACGATTWSNNFTSVNLTCGHAGSATVTFTAWDECVNNTTSVATFTITDLVKPTLVHPAQDLSIPIGPQSNLLLQNWLASHGGAEAYDLGGDVTWQHNFSTLTNGCGSTGGASVTFTVTDPCGNSVITVATIQVTDHTPPVIETTAIDTVVYCGESNSQLLLQQWLDSHGHANASDFGGNVTWQHNYNALSDSCGTTGSATVTFTASDPCGNNATTVGRFKFTDPTPPVIETVAHDTTVFCPGNDLPTVMQQWLSRHGGASASDRCGSVNWTNNFSAIIDTCQLLANYPVTFTAWDECLNSTLTNATFTVIDTTNGDTTITSVLNLPDMVFQIFPNPVDDVLTVDWAYNESMPVQLMLLDASGRKVWSAQTSSNRMVIPVDKYAAGIYFLSCKRNGSMGMMRVIVE
ncbi:MAG TPA: T9SS type A sorting domain-containing protein [Saprospiraceae bacterium]|nr:T9SS type A sorting domain-containing protein [Saprospiraceae bacterium]